jgi:hypothetical protein
LPEDLGSSDVGNCLGDVDGDVEEAVFCLDEAVLCLDDVVGDVGEAVFCPPPAIMGVSVPG